MFAVSSLRNKSTEEICNKFTRVYAENPLIATKLLFQIGDIREGKGERHIFNSCLKFFAKEHPEILKSLLPLIPEYTRWDYAIKLCVCGNREVEKLARKMVVDQIEEDKKNAKEDKSISLCAKWMPSIQSKKPEDRKLALKLEKELGMEGNHKAYRKLLSELRGHLNIIEKNLSQKTMDEVDFSKMTSKQMLKYSETLKENQTEEFNEYLEKVAKGEAKKNSGVNTPVDVLHKYCEQGGWSLKAKSYDEATELLWQNLKDTIGDVEQANTFVIRDGSGSMTCGNCGKGSSIVPLEVSTALAIYCSEKLTGGLKDKFITFSSSPEVVDMSNCKTLHEKLKLCLTYDDYTNTDLKATFDLILKTLQSENVTPEDAPKTLIIVSDMEFDCCHRSGPRERLYPLFSTIRDEWAEAGYKLPCLAFWQVNTDRSPIPEIDNELGLILLSGYTTENLDMVISGELAQYTPEKQLEIVLSKPRYDAVEKAFTEGLAVENKVLHRTSDPIDMDNDTSEVDENHKSKEKTFRDTESRA